MKVVPVGVPNQTQQTGPTNTQQSARDKAINAFMGGKAEDTKAEQARIAAERAANIAAITAETPVPQDYVQQAQQLSKTSQPVETTQEVVEEQPQTVDKNTTVEATQSQSESQDQEVSERYQLLARKERQLRNQARQQQEALQKREADLKAREEAAAAKEAQYRDGWISKQKLKEQTLEALAEAEVSYDEITQKHLERPQTDPATLAYIQKLEHKLAKIEEAQNETKKTWETAQTQSYDAALKQIKTDAQALVRSNPDDFEGISATPGAINDVVKLIEMTYKEEGVLMTVEEAAQEVENEIIDRSLNFARLKKIQSRLKPEVATQAPAPKQQAEQQQQPMKTLTNTVGSTKPLTRRERAVLAALGQLK